MEGLAGNEVTRTQQAMGMRMQTPACNQDNRGDFVAIVLVA